MEKMEWPSDLTVREGEYLSLDPEDIKGYVDLKLVEMIRDAEIGRPLPGGILENAG